MESEKSTSEILEELNDCENHEFMIADDVKKVVRDLQSQLKQAMQIGTAYCEHAKQTQDLTERLVKALEEIAWHSNVQSSAFAKLVSHIVRKATREWHEHQEWKSLRDYEFCKHEEEDDESPY